MNVKRGLCTGACPLHRGGPWATTCRSMTNLMDDFKPTARWMVSPSLDQHTYPPLALRKLPGTWSPREAGPRKNALTQPSHLCLIINALS